MNFQIRLLIHKRKSVYDDVVVSPKVIFKYNKSEIDFQETCISSDNSLHQKSKLYPILLREKGFNAYLVSLYIYTINHSDIYRKSAINVLKDFIKKKTVKLNAIYPVILIGLQTPKYQFLDYSWNQRLAQMIMERQEIDHAMSWLSTLGGAFSALGDQFDRCAKVAGKISVEQFKLAMRLGDPQLVARCKLYAALSLLQQGYYNVTRLMVEEIFRFAVNDKDVRLQNMCHGVWAKLKYCYSLRTHKIKSLRHNLSCKRRIKYL